MTQSSGKTVLIVDDEDDVVNFLEMACEDAGFNVITASDGIEALERVKEQIPDIISLDVVMPRGSGIKFYRELSKNPDWSNIPVIIVTGHARDELGKADFNEMTMSGPGVYLEKPVTAKKYVHAIESALGIAHSEDTSEESQIKEEVKSLIDDADPETLREILAVIKEKKQ